MQTDRPIYRPGDKLMAKIAGVRRASDGYRTLGSDFTVHAQASDPNGNVIFEKRLPLGDFGSCDLAFEIPKGKLLGAYTLSVSAERGLLSGSASASFQVEEYKRPEFEIVFDKIEKQFRFGRPAELTGSVKYYFGGAAANADVDFTVTHSLYVPWYFRSWFYGGYQTQAKSSAAGKIKTDDNGKFRIVFTPQAADLDLPAWLRNGLAPEIASYDVTVNARDSGGRTITGAFSCRVGARSYYFIAEPDKGFYFEKDKAVVDASKLSVNDQPLPGEASYEVHLLKDSPLRTWTELGYGYDRSGNVTAGLPGPEFQLKDAENGPLAARGALAFGADGKSRLTLPALAPGAYRLTLKGKDDDGEVAQNKIFLVAAGAGKDNPVNLTSVTLFEKDEYKVGDTARLLIGSRFGAGTYVVELWSGEYFVRNLLVDDRLPVRTIEIPVTADMKGGFTVRWFGVKGLDVLYGEAAAAVPWSEKNLSLALEPFKDKLLPGEKASWGVKIKNAAGKPVAGEALVLMYDRSLEYYATSDAESYGSLYFPNSRPNEAGTADFQPRTYSSPVRTGPLYDQLYNDTRMTEDVPPGFRTDRTVVRSRAMREKEDGEMLFDAMPAPAPEAATETLSKEEARGGAAEDKKNATGQIPAAEGKPMPAVQARSAFADTAFFLPHIVTDKNGEARFTFTAPEQLTGWKIKAVALTGDVSWGELEKEAVTQKDLMVRLDLPRFFREKDKGTVTAVVHNESEGDLTGRVWIDVLADGASVLAGLKLADPSQTFTVKAHGQATFDWPVEIPAGLATYTVRAVAKTDGAGSLEDAEERPLPILPSRERLIESAFAVIRGSENKTIAIPAAADPTRINESVTRSESIPSSP